MNIIDNIPDISFIENATMEDVLTQMINDYKDKYKDLTGREAQFAPANPYRLILNACAMQIYQAMQYADYAGKMSFLKYAKGEYLDNLAALRGEKRRDASAARTVMQFYIAAPLGFAVSIPAGCRITNGNDIFFATDEYAEIPAGETETSAAATCTESGTLGNGFASGEINVLVNTLPYITRAANSTATYGGADKESDESLRNRVYSMQNAFSTAGPAGAYVYHTKKALPDIEDVAVQSPVPGEVIVYFICKGGAIPGEELIQDVKEYLDDRSIRPLTDKVMVRAPVIQRYDVDLTYYIARSTKEVAAFIEANVNEAVSAYNIWQTEKIGRDINPSCLIQKVMEAGVKRVVVESPVFTILNGETVASIKNVTVRYGGMEDD